MGVKNPKHQKEKISDMMTVRLLTLASKHLAFPAASFSVLFFNSLLYLTPLKTFDIFYLKYSAGV